MDIWNQDKENQPINNHITTPIDFESQKDSPPKYDHSPIGKFPEIRDEAKNPVKGELRKNLESVFDNVKEIDKIAAWRSRLTRSASELDMQIHFEDRPRPQLGSGYFSKAKLVFPNNCLLPCIVGSQQQMNCITPRTVVDLICGRWAEMITEYFILDCRYPYEYHGGHITGAENLVNPAVELPDKFINNPKLGTVVIIFHCEFSSERGPRAYKQLRELDRQSNQLQYPKLTYENVFLLEGGYRAFYEAHKEFCVPRNYVPMRDLAYRTECKEYQRKQKKICLPRSVSFNADARSRNLFHVEKSHIGNPPVGPVPVKRELYPHSLSPLTSSVAYRTKVKKFPSNLL